MNQTDNVVHLHAAALPSEEEINGARSAIAANVADTDPLLTISDDTAAVIVRLYMTDPVKGEMLERSLRKIIADFDKHDKRASKFSLRIYRDGAKFKMKELAKVAAARQRLAADNLKKSKNGRADIEIQRTEGHDDAVVADVLSNSSLLKAIGWLAQNRPNRIWYDGFYKNYYTNWSGESDDGVVPQAVVGTDFMRTVLVTLQRQDPNLSKLSDKSTEHAVCYVARRDVRNEPQEWLKSLVWDGVERLPTWLADVYGTPRDKFHADVGRCWIVGMVARIMTPGCQMDMMPVLVGPQGTGKSKSLEALGGKWYGSSMTSANKTEDFMATLNGRILNEVPELDAMSSRRTETSKIKAIISNRIDYYRPPYGRVPEAFPRTTTIVGTTNEKDWQRDHTGARRYWGIECLKAIDVQWVIDNRNQMFAEAKARFDRGELWHDVDAVEAAERVKEYEAQDPIKERLGAWLDARKHELYIGGCGKVRPVAGEITSQGDEHARYGTLITTERLALTVLLYPVDRHTPTLSRSIGHAMRALGWDMWSCRPDNGKIRKVWQLVSANAQLSLDIKDN